MCGPLSVEYTTMVSSAMPSSSSSARRSPTSLSWSIIVSWYSDCHRPAWPLLSGLTWVRKCMWVALNHTKNGCSAAALSRMKTEAAARNSSSTVSIRFLVSGPVSSMRWVPSSFAHEWMTPRGPNRSRKFGMSSGRG